MKRRIVCADFGIFKEFIKKAAIPVLVFSFVVFCPVTPQHAMAQSRPLTHTLSFKGIEKVAQPEFLAKFNQGADKVKILVLLKGYEHYKGLSVAEDVVLMKGVQLDIRTRQERVLNELDSRQFELRHRFNNILGFSGEATLQAINDLASMDEVKVIEEDREMEMLRSEGVPLIRADGLHSLGYYGSGISIAVCDSGVDYTHSELGGAPLSSNTKVIGGRDISDGDDDPMPLLNAGGHGTCCAGIAAGDSGGVAPSAKIYALKVFKDDGTGTLADTAAAWDWCVTHQYDDPANPILIISNSIGGKDVYETSTCDSGGYSFFATAAATVVANGMTLFAASGNDGYCDGMTTPACVTDVISVGAVYDASFGDYYPCISEDSCVTKYHSDTGCSSTGGWYAIDSTASDKVTSYSNSASFLDILASANKANTTDIVGSGGYATGDYHDSFGGTSAACPYAAGAGALLQEYAKAQTGDYLTPAQLKSALVNYGDLITDSKSGLTHPRVNVLASIDAINGGGTSTTSTAISTSTSSTTTSIPSVNLTPYTPSGWDYPIVPSSNIGTYNVGTLCAGETTYVDIAAINEGPGDITETFYIDLYIDGVLEAYWYSSGLEANYYSYVEDYGIVVSEGPHTLKIKADSDNDVAEANETDNEYERTFTWARCRRGWPPPLYESILGEESQEKLVHLRRFRDEKLLSNDTGKEYVDLLYNHSEEVDSLLEENPDLSAYTAEVMDKLEPEATALLSGEEITISKELVEDIVALLAEFETEASPGLKVTIKRAKRMIKRGTIFKLLGITVE